MALAARIAARRNNRRKGVHESLKRNPKEIFSLPGSASQLTESQYDELRSLFMLFDTDGSGLLDDGEIRLALQLMGVNGSDEEIQSLISSIDEDGNGMIEWKEFLAFGAMQLTDPNNKYITSELDMAQQAILLHCIYPDQPPGAAMDDCWLDCELILSLFRGSGEHPFSKAEADAFFRFLEPRLHSRRLITFGEFKQLPCWEPAPDWIDPLAPTAADRQPLPRAPGGHAPRTESSFELSAPSMPLPPPPEARALRHAPPLPLPEYDVRTPLPEAPSSSWSAQPSAQAEDSPWLGPSWLVNRSRAAYETPEPAHDEYVMPSSPPAWLGSGLGCSGGWAASSSSTAGCTAMVPSSSQPPLPVHGSPSSPPIAPSNIVMHEDEPPQPALGGPSTPSMMASPLPWLFGRVPNRVQLAHAVPMTAPPQSVSAHAMLEVAETKLGVVQDLAVARLEMAQAKLHAVHATLGMPQPQPQPPSWLDGLSQMWRAPNAPITHAMDPRLSA